jgi:hypothetical protein
VGVGGPIGPGDERGSCSYCMGYTEIYMHQIGPDQEGFFRFFEKEILPELR